MTVGIPGVPEEGFRDCFVFGRMPDGEGFCRQAKISFCGDPFGFSSYQSMAAKGPPDGILKDAKQALKFAALRLRSGKLRKYRYVIGKKRVRKSGD